MLYIGDKIGKSGNQDNRFQVIRVTGNQDAGYQEIRESEKSHPDTLII